MRHKKSTINFTNKSNRKTPLKFVCRVFILIYIAVSINANKPMTFLPATLKVKITFQKTYSITVIWDTEVKKKQQHEPGAIDIAIRWAVFTILYNKINKTNKQWRKRGKISLIANERLRRWKLFRPTSHYNRSN